MKKKEKYFEITGRIVDVHSREIFSGRIFIQKGKIEQIFREDNDSTVFILPGLTDAHIHIESSMVTPGAFAMEAVKHGTTAVVSDPHEIANVLGVKGVEFMMEDAENVPLKFFFGAPSCVPATSFETSGGRLGVKEVSSLLSDPRIHYLSEMMNFPGVIRGEAETGGKIEAAKKLNKPIDGHAPGLQGDDLRKYVAAGISTDHECSTIREALEKISLGMKILIREGSAARNLEALKELFRTHPGMLMLCSDDLHPEMLRERHINKLVAGLIREGYDIFDVVASVTKNPSEHYNLKSGLLRPGDPADLIVVDSLAEMNVLQTWIAGEKVADGGRCLFDYRPGPPVNIFNAKKITSEQIEISNAGKRVRVIKALDGELLTDQMLWSPGKDVHIQPDLKNDILKIVVKDRYTDAVPVTGFICGFGLSGGAFASSVAHDSHNIIAVGTNNTDIVNAINAVIGMKGGLAVSEKNITDTLKLNIGGIMSDSSCAEVALAYQLLSEKVKNLGCTMSSPFMTLSFMALLVIPELKIGDRGLFDVNKFRPVSLFE